MGQGRQAKILSPQQAKAALGHFQTTRYPLRDQAMFLLSTKAGLRAKEIALENKASKGGGRTICLRSQTSR